jgi:hypothetical protein
LEQPTPLAVPTSRYDRLGGVYNEHWLQLDVTITGEGSSYGQTRLGSEGPLIVPLSGPGTVDKERPDL